MFSKRYSRVLQRPTQIARFKMQSAYVFDLTAVDAANEDSKPQDEAVAEDYDVVIVGGGPVGLALACALVSPLRDSSLRVALIEASDLSNVRNWHPERDDSFSNRVSSITNASRAFLHDIGAWEHVEKSRTMAIEEMQVWDGVSDARIEFGGPSGLEMARLTENLNLQRALLQRLDDLCSPNFTILDKTKVSCIIPDMQSSTWPLVHLAPLRAASSSSPAEQTSPLPPLRARLLVGADGPSSPVRAFSKIETYGWNYDARAIVATMALHDDDLLTSFGTPRTTTTAYQRFLPTGPIAYLPLSKTRASLVWSTTPALAQALVDAGDDVLARMVNAAFRLPDVSMHYLHQFILDKWHAAVVPEGADGKKGYLGVDDVEEEIRWRQGAHSIHAGSALSSTLPDDARPAASRGIPSADAGFYPPLVGRIQAGSAASFPLRMAHAERYLGHGMGVRTALVGDAAHTTHPLAGQGLNLGLADSQSLANAIHTAYSLGQDVGSYTSLERYPRERYLVNHGMLSGVDKLKKVYGTRNAGVVWARSVGLEIINEMEGVKRAFMGVAGADGNDVGSSGLDPDVGRSGSREITSGWAAGMVASAVEQVAGVVDVGKRILGQRRF